MKANGQPLALIGTLAPVDRPLLERAWVKARIARLLDLHDRGETGGADPDMKDVFKKQAIELSIKNRVLCPYTSLLVLETEQDYARFGIERRALADVITVGAGGIELLHRTDARDGDCGRRRSRGKPTTASPTQRRRWAQRRTSRTRPIGHSSSRSPCRAPRRRERACATRRSIARREARRPTAPRRGRSRSTAGRAPATAPAVAPAAAPPPPAPARRTVSDDLLAGLIGGGGTTAQNARPRAAMPKMRSAEGGRSRVLAAPGPSANLLAELPLAEAVQIPSTPPLDGTLREVNDLLHRHNLSAALAKARAWREQDPGDVLALVALGECGEASSDLSLAARAYGSIIDLFPGRADMRRFAGERLERVHGAAALALAVDTYRKAVEQRPDHPATHRLLAFALLKQGHPREAFQAIAAGAARRYPDGRFAGVDRILREDVGLIAAAWMRAEPARASEIRAHVERAHGTVENAPSVRFVLNWETDANDVDFHIHDGRGGHAYYGARQLASGGELYADVTTGYGPECFTIRGPAAGRAFPYTLQAHYYCRGPMGYGMGKLEIIEHDGHGGLHFDERPFVIMVERAFVDLGTIKGSAFATPAAIATSH